MKTKKLFQSYCRNTLIKHNRFVLLLYLMLFSSLVDGQQKIKNISFKARSALRAAACAPPIPSSITGIVLNNNYSGEFGFEIIAPAPTGSISGSFTISGDINYTGTFSQADYDPNISSYHIRVNSIYVGGWVSNPEHKSGVIRANINGEPIYKVNFQYTSLGASDFSPDLQTQFPNNKQPQGLSLAYAPCQNGKTRVYANSEPSQDETYAINNGAGFNYTQNRWTPAVEQMRIRQLLPTAGGEMVPLYVRKFGFNSLPTDTGNADDGGAVWDLGELEAGTSYTFRVIGANGEASGDYSDISFQTSCPNPIITGTAAICVGSSSTLTMEGCASAVCWESGESTTSIIVSPTVSTTYKGWCTTVDGDYNSAEFEVSVNSASAVSVSPVNPSIVAGESVSLTASNCTGSVTWSNGQTGNSISVSPITTTSYTASCVQTAGCNSSASTTVTVSTLNAPTITATPTTICLGESSTLSASGCSGTVTWSTGQTGSSITVSPTATANYTATCTVNGITSAPATSTITVNSATASVTPSSAIITCSNPTATLTATGGGTYAWSNGQTTASITANSAGTYTVTVTSANGCTATASATVTADNSVPTAPSVTATSSNIIAGESTTITASGCAGTITWSNGQTGSSITVSPTTTTNYTATCTTANGCSATTTTTITVGDLLPPVLTATPTTICLGESSTLSAMGCTGTVTWSTGQTGTSIVVSPTTTTSYTATCTVNGITSAPATSTVTVNSATASVTPSSAVITCSNPTATLTATGGGTYAWSNGQTTASISANSAGTYSVTVTSANGCTATASATVTADNAVPTAPSVTASNSSIYVGESTVLTASGCTGTVTWSNGQTGNSITVSPTSTTSYTATCTTANGCSSTTTTTVNVTPLGSPVLTATPSTICLGESSTISASGCTGTVTWSTGQTGSSITVSPTSTTSYSATCTVGGIVSSPSNIAVTVNSATASVTPSSAIITCSNPTATLTATGGGTYAWSNGQTTASITANSAGTYTVTVTSANGCTATASATVTADNAVPTAPSVTASSTSIFAGESTTLSASGCAGTITWSNGQTGNSITVSPTSTASYTATCTTANGCSATTTTTVTVSTLEPPTITATPSTICLGESTTLSASGCAGTVTWSTGQTGTSITVSPTTTTSYTAICTVNGISSSSGSTSVTVNSATAAITSSNNSISCNSPTANLTATGGGSYIWSNGETSSSIVASTAGTYAVTVTSANGCSATASIVVGANNTPPTAPTITASSSSIYNGESTVLTASGCSGTITWSNGQTGNSITVSPTSTTSYTATCTTANGCSTTTTTTVTIIEIFPPVISIKNGILCSGGTATLTASGCNGGTIRWSNGQYGNSITVSPSQTTEYGAICTQKTFSSSWTYVTVEVSTVANNPILTVGNNALGTNEATITVGEGISIKADACDGMITWSNGQTGQTITVSPTSTTTYTAYCTNSNGCKSGLSSAKIIIYLPKPVISLSGAGCAGEAVTLSASACQGIVSWSNGQTGSSITVNPISSTTYWAKCNSFGLQSEASYIQVNPFAIPKAPVVLDNHPIFVGESITLRGQGCQTFLWTDSEGTNLGMGNELTLNPSPNAKYYLQCVDNNCVSDRTQFEVKIKIRPIGLEYSKDKICFGDEVTLTATGCNGIAQWSDGQTGSTITVQPTQTTTYSVYCYTSAGNSNTVEKTIYVDQIPAKPILTSKDTVIFTGEKAYITASCENTLKWLNTPDSLSAITVSPVLSRYYTAVCYSPMGCSSQPDSILIKVITPPIKITSTTHEIKVVGKRKTISICEGEIITLKLEGPRNVETVKWSTLETKVLEIKVQPLVNTSYWASYSDTVSTVYDSLDVVVFKRPIIDFSSEKQDSTITLLGNKVLLKTSKCNGVVYWSKKVGSKYVHVAQVENLEVSVDENLAEYWAHCVNENGCISDSIRYIIVGRADKPILESPTKWCDNTNYTLAVGSTCPSGYNLLATQNGKAIQVSSAGIDLNYKTGDEISVYCQSKASSVFDGIKTVLKPATTPVDLDKAIVYPNPTPDLIKIASEGCLNGVQLKLWDIQGRLIYKGAGDKVGNLLHLDLQNLASAEYILQMIYGQKSINKIVLKFNK
jgi:Secretion system C-terminal sorting domain